MESEIVTRLRDCTCVPHGELCREAADEIERLRAELRSYTGDKHTTREPFEPTEPFTPEAL